jgi:hypothetical protein
MGRKPKLKLLYKKNNVPENCNPVSCGVTIPKGEEE